MIGISIAILLVVIMIAFRLHIHKPVIHEGNEIKDYPSPEAYCTQEYCEAMQPAYVKLEEMRKQKKAI